MKRLNCNALLNRCVLMLLLAGALVSLQGCSYVRNRYHDACDIVDIGFTFSGEPQFVAFVDAPFVELFPIGIGEVDGHFIGIGGGNVHLWAPHYESNFGLLLWGQEERTFNHRLADLEKMPKDQQDKALSSHHVGVVGTVQDMVQGTPPPTGRDFFSCPHYLHLGWIGIVGTAYYWEMLDAVVGLTTLDISYDDNRWEQPAPSAVTTATNAVTSATNATK